MYSVKPADAAQGHWEKFDNGAQARVLMAVRELYGKGKQTITVPDLKNELGMSHPQWNRWGR